VASVKFPISADLSSRLNDLKKRTGKSKRVMMREALSEYIQKYERADQGLEYVLVQSNTKQKKFDL